LFISRYHGFKTAERLTLVVVVEESVGDGHPLGSVSNIKKTIVVVLAVVKIGRQIKMITPDILRCLDTNGITVGGKDFAALEVAENNVLDLVDEETNVLQSSVAVQADDGGIRGNLDLGVARDLARDVDNGRPLCSSSLGELCEGRDGGSCSTLPTGSSSVGRGVSDRTRGNSSPVDVIVRSGKSHRRKRRQGDGRCELHF
jgi:hypothetical protein